MTSCSKHVRSHNAKLSEGGHTDTEWEGPETHTSLWVEQGPYGETVHILHGITPSLAWHYKVEYISHGWLEWFYQTNICLKITNSRQVSKTVNAPLYFFICAYLYVCVSCIWLVCKEVRKGLLFPWKWSYGWLRATMWVLRIKPRSSVRTTRPVKC